MKSKTLNELAMRSFLHARSKGFHSRDGQEVDHRNPERIASRIALIHSELSEALEECTHGRMEAYLGEHGKPEGFPIEIADAVIRILDLCGSLGIDIDAAVEQKHEYNLKRPNRHGGKLL